MTTDADIIIGAKDEATEVLESLTNHIVRIGETAGPSADMLDKVSTSTSAMVVSLLSAAAAMTAVSYATSRVAQGMDEIDKLADKAAVLGARYDDINLFAQALEEAAGISYDNAVASLQQFQQTVGLAQMGMGKALPIIKQLGINLDILSGLDVTEQFKMIASEVGKIESPAQRSAVAMKLFGDPQIAAALGKNGEAISNIQNEIDAASKRISDSATESVARVNDFIGRIANNFSDGWRRIGAELSVSATSAYDAISGLFGYVPPETLLESEKEIAKGIALANAELEKQSELIANEQNRQAAIAADNAAKVLQSSNLWKSLTDAAYIREVALTKGQESARRLELQLNNLSASQIEEVIAQENELLRIQSLQKSDQKSEQDYKSTISALERQLEISIKGTAEVEKQDQLAKARNEEERSRIATLQLQVSEQEKLNKEKVDLEKQQEKVAASIQSEQAKIAQDEADRQARLKAPTAPVQAFESRLLTRGSATADPQKKIVDNTKKMVELQAQQLKLQEQIARNKQQTINLVKVGG